MSARDVRLNVCWFALGKPRTKGPALGEPFEITWAEFVAGLPERREGEKDGPCFIPARFMIEPDGRVHRVGRKLLARTAIAMDCETSKQTGEVPPDCAEAVERVRAQGWAGVLYTSHHHTAVAPRYRLVLPISSEIDFLLPAVEVTAQRLGLDSILDTSKVSCASVFYLPSCPPGQSGGHCTEEVDGEPIDAGWVRETAGALLAERQAEQEQLAADARAQSELQRQMRGDDPEDSIIGRVREKLGSLDRILRGYGYDQNGTRFRHPNSISGSFGADVKVFAGVERVYSHNANDPLHRDNLPAWCGGVTALDAFDVTAILNYGGDRDAALKTLADRFFPPKKEERRELAGLLFRLVRDRTSPADIEAQALAEGERLGLTPREVCSVARWVFAEIVSDASISRAV
jgi:hypothetical protein